MNNQNPSGHIRLQASGIPVELTQLDQWVLYKFEKSGLNRISKIPVNNRGKNLRWSNPENWLSFEDACHFSSKSDGLFGIGFIFTEDDPFVGIDLDHCRDPKTGDINPEAAGIIRRLNTYSEISVSGTGVHLIAKASDLTVGKNFDGVEIYNFGRFFTVTGVSLEHQTSSSPIAFRDKELTRLVDDLNGRESKPANVDTSFELSSIAPALNLTFSLSPRLDPSVQQLIRSNPVVRGLWDRETPHKGQNDTSPSGYTFFLAGRLATLRVQPQQILNSLIINRQLWQDRRKPESWFRREVDKALDFASKMSPALNVLQLAQPVSTSGIYLAMKATYEHWQLIPDKRPIHLAILSSLSSSAYDGQHASKSVSKIAKEVGVSPTYVSTQISELERLMCVLRTRPNAPGRSNEYLLNLFSTAHHDVNHS